jgi:hypothetical protein
MLEKGWGQEQRGATADELWSVARLARLPHELVPGLEGLDKMTAWRFAVSVSRARTRYRRMQMEELMRRLEGDKDPFGIGRVVTLLLSLVVEG